MPYCHPGISKYLGSDDCEHGRGVLLNTGQTSRRYELPTLRKDIRLYQEHPASVWCQEKVLSTFR